MVRRRLPDGRLENVPLNCFNGTSTANITYNNAPLGITQTAFDPGAFGQYTANIQLGDSNMYKGNLWGPKRDLDYWSARAAGLVPEPERRAMRLFASECDEERFSLYCHLGTIAALGNLTKHLYIVRRYTTVMELSDGWPIRDGAW